METMPDARSNSGNWDSRIDCPTILHETMHLLGLSDGYKEKLMGYHPTPWGTALWTSGTISAPANDPAFDCRSLEPVDSVMSNQWTATEKILGTYNNPGLQTIRHLNTRGSYTGIEKNFNATNITAAFKNVLPRRPLLYPAQFRAITKPGCSSENRLYYACTQDAYVTRGKNRNSQAQCTKGLPEECGKSDLWMK